MMKSALFGVILILAALVAAEAILTPALAPCCYLFVPCSVQNQCAEGYESYQIGCTCACTPCVYYRIADNSA